MTATRDRPSDPDADPAVLAWHDRPILGSRPGLPWWGAVLLAFGLAAVAAFVDMAMHDKLDRIYQVAYGIGCVGAVCAVRRGSLFGPIVQPPLVFATTAVAAVLFNMPGGLSEIGLNELIFSVALPLTQNFPTMAIITGVTVALGVFRLFREQDPDAPRRPKPERTREPRERRERAGPSARRPRAEPAGRGRGEPARPRSTGRSARPAGDARRREPPPRAERRERGRPEPPPPRADRTPRADRGQAGRPDPARRREPGMPDGRPRREGQVPPGAANRRQGRPVPPRQPPPRRRPPEAYR